MPEKCSFVPATGGLCIRINLYQYAPGQTVIAEWNRNRKHRHHSPYTVPAENPILGLTSGSYSGAGSGT